MRGLLVSFAVLLLACRCVGQVTISTGYASNLAWNGGGPVPFVPLVTTPSISLATVFPSPIGASNGTGGNVVGATNSTLSLPSTPSGTVYTVPVWYGPNPVVNVALPERAGVRSMGEMRGKKGHDGVAGYLNLGIGAFAEPDVAEEARLARTKRTSPVRVFTNADIEQIKQESRTLH